MNANRRLALSALVAAITLGTALPAQATQTYYRLQPRDALNVTVVNHPELSVAAQIVRPDGCVSLPLLGQVQASGKTVQALTSELDTGYKPFLADPEVLVNIATFHQLRITVLGQVQHPGTYAFDQAPQLAEALAAAGGPTERADRDKVMVTFPDGGTKTYDLDTLLAHPATMPGIPDGADIDVGEVWYPDFYRTLPIAATLLIAIADTMIVLRR